MISGKLKIYSSKNWCIEGGQYILMLAAYWDTWKEDPSDPDAGRFADYLEKGKTIFDLVDSPEQADIAVYPQGYTGTPEHQMQVNSIAAEVAKLNKKLVVFYNADDDTAVNLENCIVFRTSFYKSKRKPYEYAVPGWSVDFLNYFSDKQFKVLEPQKKPTVSYCGYIDQEKSVKQKLKALILSSPPLTNERKAEEIRGKACRALMADASIETNFIIRDGFWAQGMTDKRAARKEYASNMAGSLYGIATRGAGNFSYRFYEILSCGRIPIFINTDAVLPFETEINWKDHVVWLEEKEINKIGSILAVFHSGKSPEQLKELQNSNRKLYENSISPLGFHKQLAVFLRSLVKQ